MKLKSWLLAATAAIGLSVAPLAQAPAQTFENRTIRVSNGVNEDHPNGVGVRHLATCAAS